MTRTVPEWIGATPDTPAPPRVRLRVFEAHGGRCYLTGRKIGPGDAWEIEHVIAIINGGENRESNLAPALVDAHRGKTREDMRVKKKIASVRKRHLGITGRKAVIGGSLALRWKRKVDGSVERRD